MISHLNLVAYSLVGHVGTLEVPHRADFVPLCRAWKSLAQTSRGLYYEVNSIEATTAFVLLAAKRFKVHPLVVALKMNTPGSREWAKAYLLTQRKIIDIFQQCQSLVDSCRKICSSEERFIYIGERCGMPAVSGRFDIERGEVGIATHFGISEWKGVDARAVGKELMQQYRCKKAKFFVTTVKSESEINKRIDAYEGKDFTLIWKRTKEYPEDLRDLFEEGYLTEGIAKLILHGTRDPLYSPKVKQKSLPSYNSLGDFFEGIKEKISFLTMQPNSRYLFTILTEGEGDPLVSAKRRMRFSLSDWERIRLRDYPESYMQGSEEEYVLYRRSKENCNMDLTTFQILFSHLGFHDPDGYEEAVHPMFLIQSAKFFYISIHKEHESAFQEMVKSSSQWVV